MKRYKLLYLLFLMSAVSALLTTVSRAGDHVNASGVVEDFDDGEPIQGAEVAVYFQRYWRRYSSRWEHYRTVKTDNRGVFSMELEGEANYLFIISHKDGDSQIDYVPYGAYVTTMLQDEYFVVRLWKAASVKIRGQAYFIETSSIPSNTYKVLDASSNSSIKSGDHSLTYGSQSESFSELLNIPRDLVIMPRNTGVIIEVASNVKTGEKVTQKSLIIRDFQEGIETSSTLEIDLRSKILPSSLSKFLNDTATLNNVIKEKEEEGFYLAVERQRLGEIDRLIQEAETLHESGSYELSFTKLREAYIQYNDLKGQILGMVNDAARSTYTLIAFITTSSFILGSLLHESNLMKAIFSALFNVTLLTTLRLLHPGVSLISSTDFGIASSLSFTTLIGVLLFLPRLMSRNRGEGVPMVNMVIPILSIAKRSLRRRWVRFGLTIFSVLMLVGSFISLTSFTTGYGLDVRKTKTNAANFGLLIRTANPPPEKSAAPFSGGEGAAGSAPLAGELVAWLSEDIEPVLSAPKYSTQPQRQYREAYNPVGKLDDVNLFGVLGIVPSVEDALTGFSSIISEGSYLTDEGLNEALVSEELMSKINAQLGDTVALQCFDTIKEVKIVGVVSDRSFVSLKDLDGEPLISQKIIEFERLEMDGPDFVVEGLVYCGADEVVVVNHRTVENLSGVWVNRLALSLSPEINLLEFAERTAINRGLRVWASTLEGVYLCQLAGYFEGKGLPVIIPWIIVMLNVVITMLNSYLERSREIMIYSSIGMNPHQISTIFLAEAGVVGVVGGSLGYLLGLSAYKLIYVVTPSLQVEQKVSALWSLAAIGISLTAVLVGGVIALVNSTSITPSLTRRWRAHKKRDTAEPFVIVLPLRVFEEELDEYTLFLEYQLRRASAGLNYSTRMIKKREENGRRIFEFIYSSAGSGIGNLYTKNRLVIERGKESVFTTRLECAGDESGAQAVGSLLRKIGLDWSLSRSVRVKTSIMEEVGDTVI